MAVLWAVSTVLHHIHVLPASFLNRLHTGHWTGRLRRPVLVPGYKQSLATEVYSFSKTHMLGLTVLRGGGQ